MDPLGSRNYYIRFGVPTDASPEVIRAAFLASVKRAHPDRIDKSINPLEWEFANQVMSALTRAYSVLRDPAQRAMYDASLKSTTASSASQESRASRPDPRSAGLRRAQGAVARGSAYFRNLSPSVQAEMRQRQASDSKDSVRKTTDSPLGYYGCLAACVGWGWYLLGEGSSGYEWTWKHMLGYYSASAGAAWVCVASLFKLHAWHRSPLRPSFYLTRLHFVITTLDTLAFWPLWEFRDASVVHHYTNGSYDKSTLSFYLGEVPQSLEFKSQAAVDAFWAQLRQFQEAAIAAERELDVQYFQQNNLFVEVKSEDVVSTPSQLSLPTKVAFWAAAAGVLLCLGASARNDGLREAKWFRHEPPTSSRLARTADKDISSRESAFSLLHEAQSLPRNGEVRFASLRERIAPLTLKSSGGESYVVKLVDNRGGPSMTIFVRGGATVEVDVPIGTYEFRYATGKTWYGYEFMFGPETSYAKADRVFAFTQDGREVAGHAVTLYKVRDGNLHTRSIPPEDF